MLLSQLKEITSIRCTKKLTWKELVNSSSHNETIDCLLLVRCPEKNISTFQTKYLLSILFLFFPTKQSIVHLLSPHPYFHIWANEIVLLVIQNLLWIPIMKGIPIMTGGYPQKASFWIVKLQGSSVFSLPAIGACLGVITHSCEITTVIPPSVRPQMYKAEQLSQCLAAAFPTISSFQAEAF